jgi:hypothetical protein
MGDATDDVEYTAVLCLARDVEVAAERVAGGLKAWAARTHALAAVVGVYVSDADDAAAAAGDDSDSDALMEVSSSAAPAQVGVGRGRAKKKAAPAAAAAAAPAMSAAARASAVHGLVDPCVFGTAGTGRLFPVGGGVGGGGGGGGGGGAPAAAAYASLAATVAATGSITYRPADGDVRAYEFILRDEAFASMDGLRAQHALVGVGAAAGGAGAASTSMKRMVRVAAELSNLPSLAVHWASSILARQDTASMDVMRAAMTGPAGECTVVCARARADGRGRASGRGDAMGGGACMHAPLTALHGGRLRARRAARWGTACLAAGRAPDCRCARAALPSAPSTAPHPRPSPAAALVVPRLASLTGARVQTRPT